MRKARNFVILFIISMFLTLGAYASGYVSGNVLTARSSQTPPNPEKLAKITFFQAGSTNVIGEPIICENICLTNNCFSFSKLLANGKYDIIIEKKGYLKYFVKNVIINSTSNIIIPNIQLIPGDLDSDGNINLKDLILSLRAFDNSAEFTQIQKNADINEDGIVSISDIALIKSKNNFGKSDITDSALEFSPEFDSPIRLNATEALYLIDDNEHPYSGWDFDNRGLNYFDKGLYASYNYIDCKNNYQSMLKRNFRTTDSGLLTLEVNFQLFPFDETGSANGFNIKLSNDAYDCAFNFYSENNNFYIKSDSPVKLCPVTFEKSSLKLEIDLDRKFYNIYYNNIFYGVFPYSENINSLSYIQMGYSESGLGGVSYGGVKLYTNYLVNEKFLSTPTNEIPCTFSIFSNSLINAKTVDAPRNTFSTEDTKIFEIRNLSNQTTILKKEFAKTSADICFETKFLLPKYASNVSFSINNSTTSAFSLKTFNNYICTYDLERIIEYKNNVWNTLRMEFNVNLKKVFVRFNGKDIGSFSANNITSFDNLTISFENSDGTLKLDDILVFSIVSNPEDYVPTPIPTTSNGNYVGLHVCSLWRYGFWRGSNAAWDICSAFDELTPYIGYYDEGIPEVSDWEIKWISEHGIDFQLQCWYGPANMSEPVKFPGFSQNLNDGYFNSKYKNYSKFAIMWENNFTTNCTSQNFRENLVPYLLEYYFKDPNYMVIDNKPIFSIYNFEILSTPEYFGSLENVKTELTYLKNEIKKLGYSDLIILFAGAGNNADKVTQMDYVGADGNYAYNWGREGYNVEYQKNVITNVGTTIKNNAKNMVHIPTVGVGFNAVARSDVRSQLITIDDYEKILSWTKNEYLRNTNIYPDQNSWKSKMILLSCWNEYDEGHYLFPTNTYGFGFLDTLRKVFSKEGVVSHLDAKPTQNQISRCEIMAPKGRAVLRPLRFYNKNIITYNNPKITWDFSKNSDKFIWHISNTTTSDKTGNSLHGEIDSASPSLDAMVLTESVSVDITECSFVHIRAKVSPQNIQNATIRACVYFKTASFNSWTADKIAYANFNTNEIVDIYVDMSKNPFWKGTLTGIRFDPMSEYGVFDVYLIEILKDYTGTTWDFSNPEHQNAFIFGNVTTSSKSDNCICAEVSDTETYLDPMIITNNQSIDITNCPYVKVKLYANISPPANETTAFLFFLTENSKVWNAEKSCSYTYKTGEFQEIYFDMSKNPQWKGTLTSLRLDPIPGKGAFKIYSISICGLDRPYTVFVDDDLKEFDLPVIYENGSIQVPFNPQTNISNYLNSYYEWNKFTRIFTLEIDGIVFKFTESSNQVLVNGISKKLKNAFKLFDGVPMVPIDTICDYVPNFNMSINGLTANIKTANYEIMKEYWKIKNSRVPYEWEFNLQGDYENWYCAGISKKYVKKGALYGNCTIGNDPAIQNLPLNIDSSKYKNIEIRMKTNLTSGQLCVYFATASQNSLSESKCVKTSIVNSDNYVIYKLNMSGNANWKGIVTNLRFDPFASIGEFYLDYIRVY